MEGHHRLCIEATEEANYSAYLVEIAAAVWGIEHFDVYLIGKQFTLVTDNRPLEHLGLVHTKTHNRLQHLMLEYDFTIEYRAGEDNAVADYLSRNATTTDTASVQEQLSTLNILIPEAEMDQSKDENQEEDSILDTKAHEEGADGGGTCVH
jgi:hypothetical protein